jgi:hypothetical protein
MQVYGLTVDEALKLTNGHVTLLLERAEAAVAELLDEKDTKRKLGERLADTKRAVRAELGGAGQFDASPPAAGGVTQHVSFDSAPSPGDDASSTESSGTETPRRKPIGKPPKL